MFFIYLFIYLKETFWSISCFIFITVLLHVKFSEVNFQKSFKTDIIITTFTFNVKSES